MNDLQDIVFEAHPELRIHWHRLYESGAEAASLSGSGPSLFGLFRSAEATLKLRNTRDWSPFRVLECSPVGREEYPEKLGIGPVRDHGSS